MSETNVDMLKPTELQIKKISEEMEDQSAMEVLKWAINAYAPKIALASSFGAEDVILIDMMVKINKEKARIFTLDTGRLNQETYDVMDAIRKKIWHTN
jgi:phosphoadenosine phosphosulfate reductase